MTDFKHCMFVLRDFFKEFDQNMLDFSIKLTAKGQIEHATGTLSPGSFNKEAIEKVYRKRLVAKDYRFCNTVLDFADDKFIITSR